MTPRVVILFFASLMLGTSLAIAQGETAPSQIVSLQPVIWVDNLLPTEVVAFAGQFEQTVSSNNAAVVRVTWFRDPFFKEALTGSEGLALSGEFRFYLSDISTGWHAGPVAEWVMFKFLGSAGMVHGTEFKHVFDFGVLVGHKWVSRRISFDVSARASWYAPNEYPKAKFFPRSSGQFNSHLLVSVGYALN